MHAVSLNGVDMGNIAAGGVKQLRYTAFTPIAGIPEDELLSVVVTPAFGSVSGAGIRAGYTTYNGANDVWAWSEVAQRVWVNIVAIVAD